MPRVILTLVLLLAAAFPAPASAAESFVGVLEDGRATRFTTPGYTAITTPKRIAGVARGDRIVALTRSVALGRSGRLYRFDARRLRATATGARIALRGTSFSVVELPGGRVRVLSDAGLDVAVDPATGAEEAGPGLRRADGARIAPSVALLPDGRLTGVDAHRLALVTETAPGSGVMTETRLRTSGIVRRLEGPVSFALAGGRATILSQLPRSLRVRQSQLLFANLADGALTGEAGPFFRRALRAIAPLGTVPDDRTPPQARFVGLPRTLSLRDLRVDRRVSIRVRCSAGCIVSASTGVGGRTNATTTAMRDTPGVVRVRLFGLNQREARLMRLRLGRTVVVRAFVMDWHGNRRTIERKVRLRR